MSGGSYGQQQGGYPQQWGAQPQGVRGNSRIPGSAPETDGSIYDPATMTLDPNRSYGLGEVLPGGQVNSLAGLNMPAVQPRAYGGYPGAGYQGQRSNVNPWSGYTPAQAYPGNPLQNFLNLYQYRPFPRAHFTDQPQTQPIPQTGTGAPPPVTSAPPPGTTAPPTVTQPPPQTPQYGEPSNTPTQDQALAAQAGNPIPPILANTNRDAQSFVNSFRFQNPSTPQQQVFNQLATTFNPNVAMSWMSNNAPGLRSAFSSAWDQAGLGSPDYNRVTNTFGASRAPYFDGMRYDMSPLALNNPRRDEYLRIIGQAR